MMVGFRRFFLTTLLCTGLISGASEASTLSFGALSSQPRSDVIKDTLNNREWLRFDVLANLNYMQIMAATSAGGAYAEYSIAGLEEAQSFVDALLNGTENTCTSFAGEGFVECIASQNNFDVEELLGATHGPSTTIAWFLSDNNQGSKLGTLLISEVATVGPGIDVGLRKYDEGGPVFSSDVESGSGDLFGTPTWLLYRDHVAVVPVPFALPLMLAGIGALGLVKRRQRKRQGA